jgi:hypothetical protein
LPARKAGERLAGALHLALFEQPGKDGFFSRMLKIKLCGFFFIKKEAVLTSLTYRLK